MATDESGGVTPDDDNASSTTWREGSTHLNHTTQISKSPLVGLSALDARTARLQMDRWKHQQRDE